MNNNEIDQFSKVKTEKTNVKNIDWMKYENTRCLEIARSTLDLAVHTITSIKAPNPIGDTHDFYSEADYWWPDKKKNQKYIRRDGLSNPSIFDDHRKLLMSFSEGVGALVITFLLTREKMYVEKAQELLKKWFVEDVTMLNPSVSFGQAIKGVCLGRSEGVLDFAHLIDAIRSAQILRDEGVLDIRIDEGVFKWCKKYLHWLNSHPYGIEEKIHPNNHAICWALQASVIASYINDTDTLRWTSWAFKNTFIKYMMKSDGSFSHELTRTKPYAYSLFVFDIFISLAQVLSLNDDREWDKPLNNGKKTKNSMDFIVHYIKQKNLWPFRCDSEHNDLWPSRLPSLIFSANMFDRYDLIDLWFSLPENNNNFFVRRNRIIKTPLLWVKNF